MERKKHDGNRDGKHYNIEQFPEDDKRGNHYRHHEHKGKKVCPELAHT
jgi:hypothetical protein